MSADWIKMRTGLSRDPAVISIAEQLDMDVFAVIGRLQVLWSWADEQLPDGDAPGVTEAFVDSHVCAPGFASAMEKVKWLRIQRGKKCGISFPRFELHNSQTAKARALTSRRNVTLRKRKSDAPGVTEASPEKEKEVTTPLPPTRGKLRKTKRQQDREALAGRERRRGLLLHKTTLSERQNLAARWAQEQGCAVPAQITEHPGFVAWACEQIQAN